MKNPKKGFLNFLLGISFFSLIFCGDNNPTKPNLEGKIIGSVVRSEEPISGAKVWLTNKKYRQCLSTPYWTETNNDGNYFFEVPEGKYMINVCWDSFYDSTTVLVEKVTWAPELDLINKSYGICDVCGN